MEPQNTPTPEQANQPGSAREKLTPATEKAAPAAPAQPASTPTPAAASAAAPQANQPLAAAPSVQVGTPSTADDVDVIEKEWVDAAEAVVEKYANDPHQEEEGFENLQVDYLKKRYGKDIKKPEN
jgi:hypothetical protein